VVLLSLSNVMARPWRQNLRGLRFHFKRVWNWCLPAVPLPVWLPYGGWWLAGNDVCSDAVFVGNFEEAERRFVQAFLRPGMTVIDAGAHHGFYTMLAARKVGETGRVIAFEPSPREHARLLFHLRLNRLLPRTTVSGFALGKEAGIARFHIVRGRDTGCNSLRPPMVSERTELAEAQKTTLDNFARAERVERVDFLKIDVEGGELDVLQGADALLSRPPRPVILAEIDDGRCSPWGHSGVDIYDFLCGKGYEWFQVTEEGKLSPRLRSDRFHENLVALPRERLDEVASFLGGGACSRGEDL